MLARSVSLLLTVLLASSLLLAAACQPSTPSSAPLPKAVCDGLNGMEASAKALVALGPAATSAQVRAATAQFFLSYQAVVNNSLTVNNQAIFELQRAMGQLAAVYANLGEGLPPGEAVRILTPSAVAAAQALTNAQQTVKCTAT